MPIYNPQLEQTATLIVAASDSLYPERADFTCDGTADDVEINAAFALGAADTRVVLLDGTYTLADPIAFTHNNQVLEGQGRGTFIDGDGLATTEHAIVISALTNCVIRDLAVQTQDGGAKTCHCIHVTGVCNDTTIQNVTIVDSDDDGIHIDVTGNIYGMWIRDCNIEDTDGVGIYITATAYLYRFHIVGNNINSCGGHGMYLSKYRWGSVVDNVVHNCSGSGIFMTAGSRNAISNNVVHQNTQYGIYLQASVNNTLHGNSCWGNTLSGIYLMTTTDSCSVASNMCTANANHGILIQRCDYVDIVGNQCHANSQDGIHILGDATDNADFNNITSNVCTGNTDDGIEIAGGADANSNQIIGNMVRGNTGTAIVDGGTLTVIKDNEGIVGFGDDKTATLVVAASNSMQPANSDYYCDGAADDVQINAALAALPAAGGKVVLLEGTFTLADPISIPANNIILEGLGEATFIDGDGLATGEHAILVPARTNCTICNLRVQTEDGGLKTCHCIYVTGLCSGLKICEVTITDSDSDGIHIEPEDADDIHIHNCTIDDADDYGIFIDSPAGDENFRSHVKDCQVMGTGSSGIFVGNTGDGNWYAEVNNNLLYGCGGQGIQALEMYHCNLSNNICVASTSDGIIFNGNHCGIEGNNCYNNGGNGIELATATECNVDGNVCTDNTQSGIELDGASNDNTLNANHCSGNTLDGFRIGGYRDSIDGNFSHNNGLHGINLGNSDCSVTSNYIYDNGQTGAGTYHGINVGADADRTQINDNLITDPGDRTEDGISLASGAVNCQICGNYIYNLMGDGIKLAGSNTSTLIKDNYCLTLDENGMVITDSVDCTVSNNHCENNTHHGIYLDNVDEANVNNNYCRGNDRLNSTTYDGIYVDVDSSYVNIVGNHCTENDRYGIYVLSVTCELTANHALTNTTGQISAAAGCVMAHNETGATAEVHEPREATLVVAASDSLTASADLVCDGTADDVQINAALAALPAQGGRVILLEGTFTLADPITIPDDNITLEGQGRSTFIDGDGLATGEHGIVISGKTYVTIRHLAIQTEDGGFKVSHCIFIEDGANNTAIDGVVVINSDSDGIHVEGTTMYDVCIRNCHIEAVDYVGIYIGMDGGNLARRFKVENNTVVDAGTEGFYITWCQDSEISGNTTRDAGGSGVYFASCQKCTMETNVARGSGVNGIHFSGSLHCALSGNQAVDSTTNGILLYYSDECTVNGNICTDNTQHGISILQCDHCTISENACNDNGMDGINVTGNATDNSDYNSLTGNICTDNSDDGIAIEGVGDANKNIVVANNLFGNTGTNLVDSGTASQIGHNVTS